VSKGSINVHAGSKVVSFLIELTSLAYQVMQTNKYIILSMALFEALKVSLHLSVTCVDASEQFSAS
jgi:hypothetical protein